MPSKPIAIAVLGSGTEEVPGIGSDAPPYTLMIKVSLVPLLEKVVAYEPGVPKLLIVVSANTAVPVNCSPVM